jgi:hypothetical protein
VVTEQARLLTRPAESIIFGCGEYPVTNGYVNRNISLRIVMDISSSLRYGGL